MRTLNHSGLFPQERMDGIVVGIVGTGSIGSFVALALAKMGVKNIVTWDFDKVEEHNIANQMMPVDSVGKKKAIVTREMVKQFSGEDITCLGTKATSGKAIYEFLVQSAPLNRQIIVVLAVDSLDVRKQLAEQLRDYPVFVVDPRMGARTYRVLAFRSSNHIEYEQYAQTLVSDAEAVQERCGQKSIIYTVLGVAAETCAFIHQIACKGFSGTPFTTALRYHPHPVTFDYGTGIRLQKQQVTEVVSLVDEELAI